MRFMFGNTSLQRYSLYFRLTMIENHRSVLTLVQTKFGFNFSFKLAFQETQLSQEKSAICLCAAGCYDVQWRKYGSKSGGHQARPKGRTSGRSLEARRGERERGPWGGDVPRPHQLGGMGAL